MRPAGEAHIFWMVLGGSLLASLAYLLIGALLVVPASSAREQEGAGPRDNRLSYFLRFLVMLVCPVIGPLFFILGHLFYLVRSRRGADLTSVAFSKERTRTFLRADEERERDLIPLEEALLVNEKKTLRRVMMNVIREDVRHSLASITLALNSGDSETSHYAAAVLSDELNKFRIYVQRLWKQSEQEGDEETECEEILLDYMDNILKQRIFSDYEQRKFVSILASSAELLYRKDASKLTLDWYEMICLRTLEVREFRICEVWCGRLARRFPQELPAYTCRLKLYFATQERDAFFTTLDSLKKSNVVLDNETLELIRTFS